MGNVQNETANWAKSGYKTLIRNSEATQKKRWPRSKILHDKQLTSFTLNLNFEACSVACEAIEVMPLYFCIFCSHYFGGHLTVIYAHGNPENNFGSISFVEYLVQHSWSSDSACYLRLLPLPSYQEEQALQQGSVYEESKTTLHRVEASSSMGMCCEHLSIKLVTPRHGIEFEIDCVVLIESYTRAPSSLMTRSLK